jgi:hypothetical protein
MTTMTKEKFIAMTQAGIFLLSICGSGGLLKETQAFSSAPPPITCLSSFSSRTSSSQASKSKCCSLKMAEKPPAGSFFHEVPPSDDESNDDENKDIVPDFDESISQLIRQRREPPLASRPSTIDGVPTEKAGTGFGKPQNSSSSSVKKEKLTTKPYVAIGEPDSKQQPINDPSKPERDDQGYTLYTDTETGKKSRVFEALVEYPSIFTMVRYVICTHIFFHFVLFTRDMNFLINRIGEIQKIVL